MLWISAHKNTCNHAPETVKSKARWWKQVWWTRGGKMTESLTAKNWASVRKYLHRTLWCISCFSKNLLFLVLAKQERPHVRHGSIVFLPLDRCKGARGSPTKASAFLASQFKKMLGEFKGMLIFAYQHSCMFSYLNQHLVWWGNPQKMRQNPGSNIRKNFEIITCILASKRHL